jgi:hypothetical protein
MREKEKGGDKGITANVEDNLRHRRGEGTILECYRSAIYVLQEWYKWMLQECYRIVTGVLLGCQRGVTGVYLRGHRVDDEARGGRDDST